MKLKNLFLLFLIIGNCTTLFAQLPPVFDTKVYGEKAQYSELKTTYLSPINILWKNDPDGTSIQNDHSLLKKGDGQADLANQNITLLKSDSKDYPALLLDFGKELHGGVQIVAGRNTKGGSVKFRIRFGESVSEAMSNVGENGATNDHAIRDLILDVPQWGSVEFGNTGFRFIRVDLIDPDTEVQINEIRAKFVYQDIPYLGSFNSNDNLLNQIWLTGAYTVQLNLQHYLWDGIKRDRLVWIGDIHPEVSTVSAVFGYNSSVPRSLDLARDNTPLPNWMNGHSSYSLWWIITQRDWYMNNGDQEYLEAQKDYLITLLKQMINLVDDDGHEILNGVRFLDWPSSENSEAIHAGLQALMIIALDAGKELCHYLNESEIEKECGVTINKLKAHTPNFNDSKQAAALLTLS